MTLVTVAELRRYTAGGWPSLSANITVDGCRHTIYMRSSHGPLSLTADPFLALALLPAMSIGADVHVNGPVSPRLLRRVAQIQDIYAAWYRDLHRVSVVAPAASEADEQRIPASPGGGVGCFFSGGVDSSYSVLKRQDEITHLALVRGFDIPVNDRVLWDIVSPAIRDAAAELNKQLVVVETNCRSLLDAYTRWSDSHGAALASIALALAPQIRMMYIAASNPYNLLVPCGSHPLLDPLWSTEQIEISHDGCELDRWGKLERLVASEKALGWLRVCCQNSDLSYNCCLCRKCLEVMVYLEAAGVLAQCPAFRGPLDLDVLARMKIAPEDAIYTEALIAAITRLGPHEHLVQALRASLSRPFGEMYASAPLPAGDLGRLAELEGRLHESEAQAARLRAQIRAVQTSPWWRWTEPLRTARSRIRHWRGKQ